MHKRLLLCLVLLFPLIVVAAPHPDEGYTVSPLVSRVNVSRMDDFLFRYIVFDTDKAYPCLRLETINPTQQEVIARRNICGASIDGRAIDFTGNIAYVRFSDFYIKGNSLYYTNEISPKKGSLYYLRCQMRILRSNLPEPHCSVIRTD